ncbi:MAG: hypothetical protein CYPHOPRED_002885, partial [Cyphobasidiales sp. Tagirdzhanova-0007]
RNNFEADLLSWCNHLTFVRRVPVKRKSRRRDAMSFRMLACKILSDFEGVSYNSTNAKRNRKVRDKSAAKRKSIKQEEEEEEDSQQEQERYQHAEQEEQDPPAKRVKQTEASRKGKERAY